MIGAAKRTGLALLPCLPVFYLIILVARYGVNVPYADEFTLAPLLLKAHDHTLTLADLFAQHNEHRYVFTRLLFIAIAFCSQGNLRAEMFFSIFLALLAGANLWWLLKKTVPVSTAMRTVVLCLFSLLLFSPVQAENWTWGFQFPLFFCNFLLTCGVVVAFSGFSLGKKFALCATISFIATFSFGGGVLLWGLTFPFAILVERKESLRARGLWLAFWGALAVASIALYFFHYVKPPYHPPIAAARNPGPYFRYITAFLGAHLSRASRLEPIFQSVLMGTILLGLYSGAVAYALRRYRDSELRDRLFPWFALGAYPLLSGALAAPARIGFGDSQALDSPYTTFSLYISVAAIALFVIVKEDVRKRKTIQLGGTAFARIETFLLTLFAICSVTAIAWGHESMANSKKIRLRGKGALLLSNVMNSGEVIERTLVANMTDAKRFANQFDKIGLMRPPLFQTAEVNKLNAKDKPAGYLGILSVSGETCTASGWAIIPKTRRPAHCVVLSYEDPVKGPILFRVAEEIVPRPDVSAVLKSEEAVASGWACQFPRSAVPPGDHLLVAWGLDAERAILYRLDTPQILH
jgi:hypothetical protein